MEISHWYGGDLDLDATGDFLMVSGQTETDQRVLRRLMTAPKAYLWQLDYGAGVPALIGEPGHQAAVRNAILEQIFEEDAVARLPEPTVSFAVAPNGRAVANITYTDATTGVSSTVPLQLGGSNAT